MIVKNEEKNIKKALGWAKPIAYEQIVVDTGSTDRTVELAGLMGAKVYHFKWVNDFSAAKNYAIEQATGSWIAFLDADEYLSSEDAEKLLKLLEKIEENPNEHANTTVLRMPWIQLNDEGEPFAVYKQSRVFRNIKEIRYVNRIHEHLTGVGEIVFIEDISIMHTGYASSSFEETSKLERNIELLRTELIEKPHDMNIKAYLADSLNNKARLENPDGTGADPEADVLFGEVVNCKEDVKTVLKIKAYVYFIVKYLSDPDKYTECEELCVNALEEFPDDLDFKYFKASVQCKMGKHKEAWVMLKEVEAILSDINCNNEAVYVTADPSLMYEQMLSAAQGLGDIKSIIEYATVVLMADKHKQRVLSPYIYTLIEHGYDEESIIELLGKVYNLGDPNDLLIIARAAKECGALDFARMVMIIAGEIING